MWFLLLPASSNVETLGIKSCIGLHLHAPNCHGTYSNKKIAITYHNYYDYSARNSGLPVLLEMQKSKTVNDYWINKEA